MKRGMTIMGRKLILRGMTINVPAEKHRSTGLLNIVIIRHSVLSVQLLQDNNISSGNLKVKNCPPEKFKTTPKMGEQEYDEFITDYSL